MPSEGNCVVGCTFDAPSTTRVELTGLRPGMEYTTTLSTESYGKESEKSSFTQTLFPGKMTSFLNVSTDTKVSCGKFFHFAQTNKGYFYNLKLSKHCLRFILYEIWFKRNEFAVSDMHL